MVTHNTIERPFGWVFLVIVRSSKATAAMDTSRRLIIFNKHVDQVIESSIEYTPERLIEIYERLLAKSQRPGNTGVRQCPLRPCGQGLPEHVLPRKRKSWDSQSLGKFNLGEDLNTHIDSFGYHG